MHTRTILATLSAFALTAATATAQQVYLGPSLPVTNITVNGNNTIDLKWDDYSNIVGFRLYTTPSLDAGQVDWQPMTHAQTGLIRLDPLDDEVFTLDNTGTTVPGDSPTDRRFYRLVAVKGDGNNGGDCCPFCPFPYIPEVTWGQVDHTIMINLTNNFKVTRHPANYAVANDPAAKTHHLYMRRIKDNTTGAIGSPTTENPRTGPYEGGDSGQKSVTLTKGYYIGVYQMTEYQYDLIDLFDLVSNPNPTLAVKLHSKKPKFGTSETSQSVSWNTIRGSQAVNAAPTGWMKKIEDAVKAGNGGLALGFDLPTEAQWEIAARAGTIGTFSDSDVIHTTGNDATLRARLDPLGWFSDNSSEPPEHDTGEYWYPFVLPVGERAPNRAGLYDVHGNVRELCLDAWNATNDSGDAPNPSGSLRARRSNTYTTNAGNNRSAYRDSVAPNSSAAHTGFRLRAGGLSSDAVVPAP